MKAFFCILILLQSVICFSDTRKTKLADNLLTKKKQSAYRKKMALAKNYFAKKKCLKFTNLLKKDITNLKTVWLKKMAYCFKKISNLKQEQAIYLQILDKNSKDYFSHFKLAKLYQKEALVNKDLYVVNTTLAEKHFKLSVQLKKNFIPSYLALFSIFKEKKIYYELQVFSEALLKIQANNKIALNQLCFSYFKQNYAKETVRICKKAIKYNAKNPLADNFVYLAVNLNKKSRKKLLLKTNTQFSKSLLAAEYLANDFYQEKNYLLSAKYYKKVLSLKSKNFLSLKQAVWSFFKNNNYKLSLESLKQLCLINKQNAVHLMRTVIAKLESNNKKKWLSPYRLSLARDCY